MFDVRTFVGVNIRVPVRVGADLCERQYIPVLKGMLNYHAKLLSAMGKPAESAATAAEAGKL